MYIRVNSKVSDEDIWYDSLFRYEAEGQADILGELR